MCHTKTHNVMMMGAGEGGGGGRRLARSVNPPNTAECSLRWLSMRYA